MNKDLRKELRRRLKMRGWVFMEGKGHPDKQVRIITDSWNSFQLVPMTSTGRDNLKKDLGTMGRYRVSTDALGFIVSQLNPLYKLPIQWVADYCIEKEIDLNGVYTPSCWYGELTPTQISDIRAEANLQLGRTVVKRTKERARKVLKALDDQN